MKNTIELITSFNDFNSAANSFMNAYFGANMGLNEKYTIIPRLVQNSGEVVKPLGQIYEETVQECISDIVGFIHHDVLIRQPGWAKIVDDALKEFDVIGVAGTEYFEFSWPNWWNDFKNPEFLIGTVFHTDGNKIWESRYRKVDKPTKACLIDGLLFFCKKEIFNKYKLFDYKTMDGFHFYDMDFSMECNKAGVSLGVVSMDVLHYSLGEMPPAWFAYRKIFKNKWKEYDCIRITNFLNIMDEEGKKQKNKGKIPDSQNKNFR